MLIVRLLRWYAGFVVCVLLFSLLGGEGRGGDTVSESGLMCGRVCESESSAENGMHGCV